MFKAAAAGVTVIVFVLITGAPQPVTVKVIVACPKNATFQLTSPVELMVLDTLGLLSEMLHDATPFAITELNCVVVFGENSHLDPAAQISQVNSVAEASPVMQELSTPMNTSSLPCAFGWYDPGVEMKSDDVVWPAIQALPEPSIAIASPNSIPLPPKYVPHCRVPFVSNFAATASTIPRRDVWWAPVLASNVGEVVLPTTKTFPEASQARSAGMSMPSPP
jgi:hypothetical protein